MEEKFDVLNEFGEFTGQVATREECHTKGLWHRAVYGFVIDKESNVLLQKRSANKKLWSNLWDVTVGGHVDSGEFGRQALIREIKEELGIDVNDDEVKYMLGSTSINTKGNIINKHYNECYIILKDIDISKVVLQKEEVSEVKYFHKDELLKRMENNYDGLTDKTGPWNFLKRILNSSSTNKTNDENNSYICEYRQLHNYSKLNIKEVEEDKTGKAYNDVEELMKDFEED